MKNRTSPASSILAALLLFALISGGVTCQVARWNECRRVHPLWYCASQDH